MTIEEWAKDFKSYVNALDMQRDDYKGIMTYIDDALALLKKREPMRVLSQRECETLPNHYERKGFCPKCHQVVEWYLNRAHCGFCGQAVKWE